MTLAAAGFPACTFTKAAGANAATALLGQIRRHCNLDRESWVSLDTLAELTGFHRSTMSRAGDRLHSLGVIEKRHGERKCCTYRISLEHWRGPQKPKQTALCCKHVPEGEVLRIEEKVKTRQEARTARLVPTIERRFQPIRRIVTPQAEPKSADLKAKIRDQLIQKHGRYLAARGRPGEVPAYWAAMMSDDPAAAQRMLDATDRRMRIERWDDMRMRARTQATLTR
jgi:DNA-binding transcriptional MocR family regulator